MTTYVTENHNLDDVRGLLSSFISEGVHAKSRVREENVSGFLSSPDALVVVAYYDDKPAGMLIAVAWEHPLFTGRRVSDMLVYVLPEYRGGAIAPRLVKMMEAWAKNRDAEYMMLGQSTGIGDPVRVIKFYERLGYTMTGFNCYKEF